MVRKKLNRMISVITILCLTLSAIFTFDYHQNAAYASDDNLGEYSMGMTEDNVTLSCPYNDKFFLEDSRTFSSDLCKASLGLAESAFAAYTHNSGEKPYDNIENFLLDRGFINPVANSDYTGPTGANTIAAAAGYKIVKDENGEKIPLIAVGVRGSGYGMEWLGNFEIGEKGNHEGFQIAADKVVNFIEQYIKDQIKYSGTRSEDSKGFATILKKAKKVKIWISGYSRAAAVSNLVAGELDQTNEICNKRVNIQDLYAYTFATPAGCDMSTNLDPHGDRYANIFNLLNPQDLVTKVAPAAYNFCRYGNDLYFPSAENNSNYEEKYNQFKSIRNDLVEIIHNGESKSFTSAGEYEAFLNYDTVNKYSPLSSAMEILTEPRDTSTYQTQGMFYSKCLDGLAEDAGISRKSYYENEQENIMFIATTFLTKFSDKDFRIIERCFTSTKFWRNTDNRNEIYNLFTELSQGNWNNFETRVTNLLYIAVQSDNRPPNRGNMKNRISKDDVATIVNKVMRVADFLKREFDAHKEDVLTLLYHELISGEMGIYKGHDIATTNGWVYTLDTLDDYSLGKYRKVTITGAVENNEITYYYPSNEKYTCNISASGQGSITCKVEEYDPGARYINEDNGYLTRTITFEISNPSQAGITLSLPDGDSENYTCVNGETTVYPSKDYNKLLLDKDHISNLQITTMKDGIEESVRQYTVYKNDQLNIFANLYENEEIVAWFNEKGDGISYENVVKLNVGENEHIKLLCQKQDKPKLKLPSTITLTKTTVVYPAKDFVQKVLVKDGKETLKKGEDYTIQGITQPTKVGEYTITIKGIGEYEGEQKLTYRVIPKGTTISKIVKEKNKVRISWKKQKTQTSGYVIEYATNSKFTKGLKRTIIKSNSTTTKVLKNIKKNTYFRIRTMKKVENTTIYSNWSTTKKY